MKEKTVKELQLIYLAVIAFGIQFVSSLQMTNMTSIYTFLGASGKSLSYLGLAAPICGLLIQPIVGQLSDDTYSKYGKRHPYLFLWALIAVFSCLALPFINLLWVVVILMWLISFSVNGATEVLRALTGDIISHQQKPRAFSWQTVLSGFGAAVAAAIPYFISEFYKGGTGAAQSHSIPLALKVTFVISAIVLSITTYWTLSRVKEQIPTHQELLKKRRAEQHKSFRNKIGNIFSKLFKNAFNAPPIIKQLGYIQIFTWIGLYAMWLFFSLALSQHLYGLPAFADVANPKWSALLEKGTTQTNFYFGTYQFFSVICAIALPFITRNISAKTTHGCSLIIGATGLFVLTLTRNPELLFCCMILVGIMWGSIMTLPFAIIAKELPKRKMGVYFGLFNISITLPQILAGILLHPLFVYVYKENAIAVLRTGAVFIMIGGFTTLYWFLFRNKTKVSQAVLASTKVSFE